MASTPPGRSTRFISPSESQKCLSCSSVETDITRSNDASANGMSLAFATTLVTPGCALTSAMLSTYFSAPSVSGPVSSDFGPATPPTSSTRDGRMPVARTCLSSVSLISSAMAGTVAESAQSRRAAGRVGAARGVAEAGEPPERRAVQHGVERLGDRAACGELEQGRRQRGRARAEIVREEVPSLPTGGEHRSGGGHHVIALGREAGTAADQPAGDLCRPLRVALAHGDLERRLRAGGETHAGR